MKICHILSSHMASHMGIWILLTLTGMTACSRIDEVILGGTFQLKCNGDLRNFTYIDFLNNKSEVIAHQSKTYFGSPHPKFRYRIGNLSFGSIEVGNATYRDSGEYTCNFFQHTHKQRAEGPAGTIVAVAREDLSPAPPKPRIQIKARPIGNLTECQLECLVNDNTTRGPLRYNWFSSSQGKMTNNTRLGKIILPDTSCTSQFTNRTTEECKAVTTSFTSDHYWCFVSNLAGLSPPSDRVTIGSLCEELKGPFMRSSSKVGPVVGGLVPALVIAAGILAYFVYRKKKRWSGWNKRHIQIRRIGQFPFSNLADEAGKVEILGPEAQFIPEQMLEQNAVHPQFANDEVPSSHEQEEGRLSVVEFPPKKQPLRRLYPVKDRTSTGEELTQGPNHDGTKIKRRDPPQPISYEEEHHMTFPSDVIPSTHATGNPYTSQPVNNQRMSGKIRRTPPEPTATAESMDAEETVMVTEDEYDCPRFRCIDLQQEEHVINVHASSALGSKSTGTVHAGVSHAGIQYETKHDTPSQVENQMITESTETYEDMLQKAPVNRNPTNIQYPNDIQLESDFTAVEETYEDFMTQSQVHQERYPVNTESYFEAVPTGNDQTYFPDSTGEYMDNTCVPMLPTDQDINEECGVYDDASSPTIYDNLVVSNRPESDRQGYDVENKAVVPTRSERGTPVVPKRPERGRHSYDVERQAVVPNRPERCTHLGDAAIQASIPNRPERSRYSDIAEIQTPPSRPARR